MLKMTYLLLDKLKTYIVLMELNFYLKSDNFTLTMSHTTYAQNLCYMNNYLFTHLYMFVGQKHFCTYVILPHALLT